MNWHTVVDLPLILGHRGASAAAPENTMVAFRQAQAEGADGIEFDVQLSADDVPVIIHDGDVARTTDGSGRVDQMTVAQLQALNAGDGAQIPTLAQLFDHFGTNFLYNLELKTHHWWNRRLVMEVTACIQQFGLTQHVLVSSFNPLALRQIRSRLSQETPTALLWLPQQNQWSPLGWLRRLYRDAADHPHYSAVTPSYMAWARQHELMVNVWTVDDAAEARRLTQLGVTAIISNRPGYIRAALLESDHED